MSFVRRTFNAARAKFFEGDHHACGDLLKEAHAVSDMGMTQAQYLTLWVWRFYEERSRN